ncbi:MAG: HD domain-containing protein [Candidatus Delongbacteria bacterium]|jgi:dGTPase|nr:HD domain-containing protein [Candidatus Delongbacteria bacterium]
MNYQEIKKNIVSSIDKNLSPYATKNVDAIRTRSSKDDIRLPFSIDRDRIIYSGAYRRSAGKTQVYYFSSLTDEQITNRIVHTQYVSQIARTIGRLLYLNLDLIEAAALGHDLGHTPFGHDGEIFLSNECEKHGIGKFYHNIHSLYIVDNFSYKGKGMNLTFQTRDAIISHDGEIHQNQLKPQADKTEKDIDKYITLMKNSKYAKIAPMTMEGCVIRLSDTIAYIGTDIEDAIHLNLLKRNDLPKNITDILGNNNGKIIDTLVKDITMNSYGKPYIEFSTEIGNALKELKAFNYENIYRNEKLKRERKKIEKGFEILFETYLEDLATQNKDSDIYRHFLNDKKSEYKESITDAEKVKDFIASMTDRYFKFQLEKIIIPMVKIIL